MSKIERTWNSKYKIEQENIGEGGNARVHKVRDCNNNFFALKELDCSQRQNEKKLRFKTEIEIMSKYKYLGCIMPVIESSNDEYWYLMPLAEPVITAFENDKITDFEKIQTLLDSLTKALCQIHSEGLAHRDIKPDNIYILNGKIYIGDFGLVDFPDNPNNLTTSNRQLGAIFTIAPEMKRYPKKADGQKADIYSLAKTIWILLTGETKGFDGQYLITGDYTLRNYRNLRNYHLVELENLLCKATSFNPDDRPTIDTFYSELKEWIKISKNYELYQISEWNFINKCLFGGEVPDSATWSDIKSIINVLNVISSLPVSNHMLFSDGGGLDFKHASEANEENCIQIIVECGHIYILNPKKLYFQRFIDPSWNYFMLINNKLEPIIGNDSILGHREYLVEDTPAHYVSARYAEYGVYDYDSGEKLPDGYRIVTRYIDGSFMFLMKNGFYNHIISTYDGRHWKFSQDEFRLRIEFLCKITDLFKKEGRSNEEIMLFLNKKYLLNYVFNLQENNNDIQNLTQEAGQNNIKTFKKNLDNFITEHILDWSFSKIIYGIKSANINQFKALYYIEYQPNIFEVTDRVNISKTFPLQLCCDGKFKKNNIDIIYFYSEENAYHILLECDKLISNKCTEAGYDNTYNSNLHINLLKGNIKPNHLFTEQEIRELMINADDRVDNRLVIDADGYARIISDKLITQVFPVRTETWCAGNAYVGKYSDLSGAKDAYLSALQKWLAYLKSGQPHNEDYRTATKESELIDEIKKYY